MTKFLLYVARQNRGVIIPFLQFAKQSYERNDFLQNSPYERDAFNLIRLHRSKAVYSIVTISVIVESAWLS